MSLKGIFWNRDERRIRSLWRLAAAGLIYVVLLVLTLVLVYLLDETPGLTAAVVVQFALAVVTIWLAARALDHRPIEDFGLTLDRAWWIDLGFGFLLGAVLISGVFLIEWLAGWVRVAGVWQNAEGAAGQGLLVSALILLSVGIYEEIAFRGYLLHNLAEGLNYPRLGPQAAVVVALLATSTLFGVLHAWNPHATALSTTNVALAGVLLATGYVLTGQLGLSIGLHMSWNFAQGTLFGFPVSGLDLRSSVFETEQVGPSVWTGGPHGPEGGLLATGAMLVGLALLLIWVRLRRGAITLVRSLAESPHRLPLEEPQEQAPTRSPPG